MKHRVLTAGLSALTVAVLLAACGSGDAPPEQGTEAPGPEMPGAEADQGAQYPVTVDNCGTDITVEQAPERIVAIKSTALELVLALGRGEALVGYAYPDGPVPAEFAEEAAQVPELSEREPSTEVVLAAEPDLIYAGWESTFTDEGLGSRASLHETGITTYVSPPACQGEGYMPDPLTFDDIAHQIAEAGDIFGAPEAAEDLISEQWDQLENVRVSEAGLSALWYSSGSDTPFVGAGIGAPQLLMETVGLTNVAGEVDDSWASMSWEAIAAAEPDVIVLVDSEWNTAEHKISVLESVPAMAALPAVSEGRYLILDFPTTEAGIRTASGAVELSEQLAQVEGELP